MIPGTAYIEMEFAGIYGTHQSMEIPIEIGVVIHQPDSDTVLFTGKAFNRNIDIELWKNIADDVGKTDRWTVTGFQSGVPLPFQNL